MTRELKSKISNKDIRKNVTKIYFFYDPDFDCDFIEIFFKPETVKSQYSNEYMSSTTAMLHKGFGIEKDMNEWLNEIAYI